MQNYCENHSRGTRQYKNTPSGSSVSFEDSLSGLVAAGTNFICDLSITIRHSKNQGLAAAAGLFIQEKPTPRRCTRQAAGLVDKTLDYLEMTAEVRLCD